MAGTDPADGWVGGVVGGLFASCLRRAARVFLAAQRSLPPLRSPDPPPPLLTHRKPVHWVSIRRQGDPAQLSLSLGQRLRPRGHLHAASHAGRGEGTRAPAKQNPEARTLRAVQVGLVQLLCAGGKEGCPGNTSQLILK